MGDTALLDPIRHHAVPGWVPAPSAKEMMEIRDLHGGANSAKYALGPNGYAIHKKDAVSKGKGDTNRTIVLALYTALSQKRTQRVITHGCGNTRMML